jgi:hypothetical protein
MEKVWLFIYIASGEDVLEGTHGFVEARCDRMSTGLEGAGSRESVFPEETNVK